MKQTIPERKARGSNIKTNSERIIIRNRGNSYGIRTVNHNTCFNVPTTQNIQDSQDYDQ